jgi:GT2 family glycosyltransferase/glycosyltransferase involved in cell wall biosynthesis
MKRVKVLLGVGKKATKKLARGDLKYKGKGPLRLAKSTVKYGSKNGLKALVVKTKRELLAIDSRYGTNLHFSNGIVSGVDQSDILGWYEKQAKPVTVVIPSYNDLDVLVPCLNSIKKTTSPKLVQILVVDDYCQPEHRKKLEKLNDEQVRVIFRDKNGGFAKAVNTGFNEANKSQDVVLLNSDIVAHENWLEGLQYGAYEFGTNVGIVGPKLLYPDGRIQSAGSYRNTEAPEWFDHYYRFQDSNYGPANVPHYCLGTTGAAMYIKREFMDYVGILDDKFQFAFEDMDWCLRGWEAGYRTLYFPSSTLTHLESATRSKNAEISPKEKQSVKYFWEKWGDWFDKRNVRDSQGRIRIIYVLQTLGLSGGIKVVFEHANRLPKDKFAVEVWGLDHHDRPWEVDKGVKIRTFKNYDHMTEVLAQEEAVKVATWWETAFPVWLASVKNGIPVYFIQEIESWFYPDDIVAQSVVVSCYRKEFKNLTTSQYNLEEINAMGLKAVAVPCGIDTTIHKQLTGVKREANMLLAVGRTFFQKNFKFTLKSWQEMGPDRPELVLYGAEPNMAKLDKKITYFNKPPSTEVNELFNKATVFVQTSRHEGFCLPILEAMAGGAAVVCTDAHGNRDFCFDGKNCLMVEQDDVAGLTKTLTKLFNNKKLQDRLSKEGLKIVKKYSWDVIIKQVGNFYEGITS